MEHHGERIRCKTMIINCDTTILDYVDEGNVYMAIHADYTQKCYSKYPDFTHYKIKSLIAITEKIKENTKQQFNLDSEVSYNPLVLEPKEKRITLVSATRLSPIKGGARMKILANALDRSRNKLYMVHLHKRSGYDTQ